MKNAKIGFSALQFFSYIAFGLCMSNFIPYMARLGYDSFERGIALSAYAILTILLQIIFGIVSDKMQISKAIALGSLGLLGVSALLFYGSAHNSIIVVVLLVGVCGGLVNSLCGFIDTWIIGVNITMAESLSRIKIFGSIGWTIGSLLSAIIISLLGFKGIASAIVLFVGAALLVSKKLPDMKKMVRLREHRKTNAKELFTNQSYLFLVAALFVLYGLVVANTGIVVDKMLSLRASQFEISLKWAMGSLLEIPMYAGSAILIRKFGNERLLSFTAIVLAIQFLGFSVAQESYLQVLLSSLQVFTTPIILITSKFIIVDIMPQHLQASSQMMAMSIYIGGSSFVIPVLSGFLASIFGYDMTLMIYAGIAFLVLIVFWKSFRIPAKCC